MPPSFNSNNNDIKQKVIILTFIRVCALQQSKISIDDMHGININLSRLWVQVA